MTTINSKHTEVKSTGITMKHQVYAQGWKILISIYSNFNLQFFSIQFIPVLVGRILIISLSLDTYRRRVSDCDPGGLQSKKKGCDSVLTNWSNSSGLSC